MDGRDGDGDGLMRRVVIGGEDTVQGIRNTPSLRVVVINTHGGRGTHLAGHDRVPRSSPRQGQVGERAAGRIIRVAEVNYRLCHQKKRGSLPIPFQILSRADHAISGPQGIMSS